MIKNKSKKERGIVHWMKYHKNPSYLKKLLSTVDFLCFCLFLFLTNVLGYLIISTS